MFVTAFDYWETLFEDIDNIDDGGWGDDCIELAMEKVNEYRLFEEAIAGGGNFFAWLTSARRSATEEQAGILYPEIQPILHTEGVSYSMGRICRVSI